MRRAYIVLGVVAVIAIAAAIYFGVGGHRPKYEGLAGRFPASTEMFAETTRLGQWMNIGGEPEGEAAQAPMRSDPILQVLGQVWAAEPVRPQDLPTILQNQPMAFGIWRVQPTAKGSQTGAGWAGGALMTLAPGQRAPLEKFLEEKLPGSAPAGDAGAVALKRFDIKEGDNACLYWGVGDDRAVIATSENGAKALAVASSNKGLASSDSFNAAVAPLKAKEGALLYVSGDLFSDENAASIKKAIESFMPVCSGKWCSSEPEKPEAGEAKPEGEEKGKAVEEVMSGLVKPLKEFASLRSISGVAFWTAPPSAGRALWDAAVNVSYKDQVSGLWKLLSQTGNQRPLLQERLPRDGSAYLWEGGIDFPSLYREALEEAGRSLPPNQMGNLRGAIGLAEGKLDLSFANDLLPTLGGECAAVFSKNGDESRWAAIFSLQDPRRFESLINDKVSKSISLKPVTFPGARGWTFGGEKLKSAITLLVSGGAAIVTEDPAWALSTGGEAGRAWKKISSLAEPISGALVITPKPGDKNGGMAVTTWTFSGRGILARAEVPGAPIGAKEKAAQPVESR